MEIYVKNASINFQCENDGKAIGVRLGRRKKNLVGERMKNRRKIYFKPLLENSSLHVSTLFIFPFYRSDSRILARIG